MSLAYVSSGIRVSSLMVRALGEALELMGVPAAAFLAEARIDIARDWFPVEEVDALMVAAAQRTRDPVFGLHWGERSPMMQVDLAPALVACAPTLRTAIDDILHMMPLLATRAEYRLSQRDGRCTFEILPLATSALGRRIRTEHALACFTRLLGYFGLPDTPRRITVAYAAPEQRDEYTRVLGAVRFDQPRTTFSFAEDQLDAEVPLRNRELHAILRARTDAQVQRVLGQLSYREQLESHVRNALPKLPSVTDAAQALHLSERSLRRRLAEEQLSYSQLVDDVQRQRAHELLQDGAKTVKEIAYELGFSGASSFHRAFRRWTGSSPARERAPRAKSTW